MNVLFPTTLEEACTLAAATPGVVPMAGGTDLLVHWPSRSAQHDRTYLDLSGVAGLRSLKWTPEALRLGALSTYWDFLTDARAVREFPILAEAARQVGAVQIQSRGTWAGNIANGSPAADGVPVLMACDAEVVLKSKTGSRTVALSSYYTGYRKSVRREDELISEVIVPRRVRDIAVFHKVGPRRAQAITKVGLALSRVADPKDAAPWRVVANSVAPTVLRCPALERLLNTRAPIRSPEDFLPAATSDVSPIDDIRSTAEYRRTVLCRLLYHSVRGVCPSVT